MVRLALATPAPLLKKKDSPPHPLRHVTRCSRRQHSDVNGQLCVCVSLPFSATTTCPTAEMPFVSLALRRRESSSPTLSSVLSYGNSPVTLSSKMGSVLHHPPTYPPLAPSWRIPPMPLCVKPRRRACRWSWTPEKKRTPVLALYHLPMYPPVGPS